MLPWQTPIWQTLTTSRQNNRLAHGLLFHGPVGIGKNLFATEFANWLICEQPLSEKACGACRSCLLIKAGSHPDFLVITPEEEGKAIKVDQIRGLIDKLTLATHGQGYRVIIISPADAMNINASNSLLKTLEEPPQNTFLILISDMPSTLVATIRSRTQMIRFDLPTQQECLPWLNQQNHTQAALLLKLSDGAPLTAVKLASAASLDLRDKFFDHWEKLASGELDALEIATIWLKLEFKINAHRPLNWVTSWIMDMIRIRQGGHISCMVNQDYATVLQKLAGQVDVKSLYGLLDRVMDTLRFLDTSANQQILLEGILLHWAGLKRGTGQNLNLTRT